MKKSSKAALLSGLIFPGIGHFFLKQHLRGSVLMLLALVSFAVIVTRIFERALTVVDRINNGEIPVDTAAIAEMVSKSASSADSLVESAAMIVLVTVWVAGIIDSYRLGTLQEE